MDADLFKWVETTNKVNNAFLKWAEDMEKFKQAHCKQFDLVAEMIKKLSEADNLLIKRLEILENIILKLDKK